jgi:hypothetical protein
MHISVCVTLLLVALIAGINCASVNQTSAAIARKTESRILLAKSGLTLSQCIAACEVGVEAMAGFCRLIPVPAVAAACWGVYLYAGSATSIAVCTGFCAWYFD